MVRALQPVSRTPELRAKNALTAASRSDYALHGCRRGFVGALYFLAWRYAPYSAECVEGVFSEVPLGDSPESSTRNGAGHHTVFGGHLALPNQHEPRRSQKIQRQHHQRVQTHPKNRAPGSEDQAVDVDAGE